jgi:hypothetical protein
MPQDQYLHVLDGVASRQQHQPSEPDDHLVGIEVLE